VTARAWAEVDLAAVRQNVVTLRNHVAPAAVCVVVKADAYGHGAVAVGGAALEAGAAMLAVAQVDEAAVLRDAGISAPILLLSEPAPTEIEAAVAFELELTAYTARGVAAIGAAASARSPVKVHLKVDTGMHRVGAAGADLLGLAQAVARDPALELEAVWTHCAVADEPANEFTATQLARFDELLGQLSDAGVAPRIKHAANSAAAIAHPAGRYDLVRCGIAVYGIDPARDLHGLVALEPALRFASSVSHLQRVPAGDGISYGLRHRFATDTLVATVSVGYADGVPRRLGLANQRVAIGGASHPIVGVVTMDQLMVDVGASTTDIAVGDEVVLLGAQDGVTIAPDEWADVLDTIAYEIVCGIGPRVERRYVG
jgi:alanine racemase